VVDDEDFYRRELLFEAEAELLAQRIDEGPGLVDAASGVHNGVAGVGVENVGRKIQVRNRKRPGSPVSSTTCTERRLANAPFGTDRLVDRLAKRPFEAIAEGGYPERDIGRSDLALRQPESYQPAIA